MGVATVGRVVAMGMLGLVITACSGKKRDCAGPIDTAPLPSTPSSPDAGVEDQVQSGNADDAGSSEPVSESGSTTSELG